MGTRLTHAVRPLAAIGLSAGALVMTGPAASAAPTCADTLGVTVHGQHIVADYVTGLHGELLWPPAGQVGRAVAGMGATVPGGPGPGFHFPNGFAPGASFCTGSRSPGLHL